MDSDDLRQRANLGAYVAAMAANILANDLPLAARPPVARSAGRR